MKVLPITIRYDKNIGMNVSKKDKLKIGNMVNLKCTLHIHPIQRETNWIRLQKVFHILHQFNIF